MQRCPLKVRKRKRENTKNQSKIAGMKESFRVLFINRNYKYKALIQNLGKKVELELYSYKQQSCEYQF